MKLNYFFIAAAWNQTIEALQKPRAVKVWGWMQKVANPTFIILVKYNKFLPAKCFHKV